MQLTQDKVFGRSLCQPSEHKSSLPDMIPTRDMDPISRWEAIAIPYLYEELRLAFNRCYDDDKWAKGKFNIWDFCNDNFSKQH
ncbi:hypothetical protein R1flu_018441 [Riccia fluitans]|uniref:Uncharacterized protein n=1 Tax=Riccia fluitans TaxID=41844 RepID=A0ABD1ZG15_9MARC